MDDDTRLIEETLAETNDFIQGVRPLLGIAHGNSLGARADRLYVKLVGASNALSAAVARAEEAERKRKALAESLADAAGWLEEAAPLLTECADDLKQFYVPEKGWPPHVEAAANMAEDCKQMATDARAALASDGGERA